MPKKSNKNKKNRLSKDEYLHVMHDTPGEPETFADQFLQHPFFKDQWTRPQLLNVLQAPDGLLTLYLVVSAAEKLNKHFTQLELAELAGGSNGFAKVCQQLDPEDLLAAGLDKETRVCKKRRTDSFNSTNSSVVSQSSREEISIVTQGVPWFEHEELMPSLDSWQKNNDDWLPLRLNISTAALGEVAVTALSPVSSVSDISKKTQGIVGDYGSTTTHDLSWLDSEELTRSLNSWEEGEDDGVSIHPNMTGPAEAIMAGQSSLSTLLTPVFHCDDSRLIRQSVEPGNLQMKFG